MVVVVELVVVVGAALTAVVPVLGFVLSQLINVIGSNMAPARRRFIYAPIP